MTKNYVCHTPYLSKHTSFDYVFCCTSLKWWHLQILFSFFQNFGFLRGAKMTLNDTKNCVTLYLRGCTPDCGFWYTFLRWWYIQYFFFIFSKFWFLGFSKFINNAKRKFWGVPYLIHRCVIFVIHHDLIYEPFDS